jgi:hypothetical protein
MSCAIRPSAPPSAMQILTLREAARELKCSRAQLYNILGGRVAGLPPLPVFHVGRRTLIRSSMLHAWVQTLEAREREGRTAGGNFAIRDEEWETIAGA